MNWNVFFFRRRIFAYYLGFFFYLLETSAKVWLSSWTLNPLISVHCVSFNRRGRKKKGSSSSLSCYTLKFYFCEFLGSLFFSYFVLILLPIKKKFFLWVFSFMRCSLPPSPLRASFNWAFSHGQVWKEISFRKEQ